MRAEQEDQRVAKELATQAEHREAMRADMAASNALQLKLKVPSYTRSERKRD
jgi:hypothetical protein